MSLRCLVIINLIFQFASSKNIPVEIVYEESNPSYYGNRNLDARVQLSPDEFLKFKLSDDILNARDEVFDQTKVNSGVRNLDEKIQLSPEELNQTTTLQPNEIENGNSNLEKVSQGVNEPDQEIYLINLLKKAEEIAYSGVNAMRDNFDKASEAIAHAKPNAQTWQQLNQTLEQFFNDQYKRVTIKQDQPPNNNQNNQFLQNLINNFQSTMNNFIGNIQNNNQSKPQGSEDEQQGAQNQNPWQNFINFFSNGINQVVNNMNNINAQNSTSSGQEDTGTGGGSGGNLFGNFVSSVQQFFGGQNNQGNPIQSALGNQSDTGVQQPSNPGGFFQQTFNNVINNFRPSTTPKVEGDEGVSSTTQSSNFFGNIGQAIQNNFFGSTQRPQGGSSNPISSGAQAIGSQFGIGGGGNNGSNPFVSGAQAIGSQFGIGGSGNNSSNPFVSGAQAIGSQFGGQGGNNPLQGIQNAIGGGSGAASSTEQSKASENEKKKIEENRPEKIE